MIDQKVFCRKVYIPKVHNYVLLVPMVRTSKYELKVLSFLLRHFSEKYSINQLAKQIGLTPKGMHKLLKRLESQEIITPQKLGNAIFYELNFKSELAVKTAVVALFEDIELPYAKAQAKDIERMHPYAKAAVLFGSVLTKGEKAGDIDVMFVIDKKKYETYSKALNELRSLKTKPIQDIIQTFDDLVTNLKKPDKVVLEIIKTGKILWGHDILVNAVKKASQ